MMSSQRRWSLPETLGLYVGSGADVYHGLEFCAAAAQSGHRVSVVLSRPARIAMPDDAWRSVGKCRDVMADELVLADHFSSRGAGAVLAVCFDLALDGERVARLAEGLPSVAVEALAFGQSQHSPRPVLVAGGAQLVTISAGSGEPQCDYPTAVMDALGYALGQAQGPLRGKRVVVTAGGTREPIDPVRFITNRSSGLMGHALALAARDWGASVTLITSANRLPSPCGVERVPFRDVASLRDAVLTSTEGADALVMAAAVSDYRPRFVSPDKIKKSGEGMTLELDSVPNFIPEVPREVLRVGFAAETDPDPAKAAKKLVNRGFDLLCLNDVSRPDAGFEVDTNALCILDRTGVRVQTPVLPKTEIAQIVMEHATELLAAGGVANMRARLPG